MSELSIELCWQGQSPRLHAGAGSNALAINHHDRFKLDANAVPDRRGAAADSVETSIHAIAMEQEA